MKTNLVPKFFSTVLVAVVLAAAMIGAWQSIAPSPTEVAEQQSAFVQSGGVTADTDPSVPAASQALSHTRALGLPEVTASTF